MATSLKEADIIYATVAASHHDMDGHPECAARVPAIMTALRKHQLIEGQYSNRVKQITDFSAASVEDIMRVHSSKYIMALEHYTQTTLTEKASIIESMAPTYATATSFQSSLEVHPVAKRAVGAAMALVDAVVVSSKDSERGCIGFGICRPPGHHAIPSGPMGFCIFGTVAVAVRHAQRQHGLAKVMVYDFDVHHGNGTQDIFYDDPSVLFVSSHQDGAYPGTGRLNDIGSGDGEGSNINIPLPPGSGDAAALLSFDNIVAPAAERFQPDIIIVSAGYDAHFLDPLASLQFQSSTYHSLCSRVRHLADRLCHGRLVLLLEGGYHLQALGESVTESFFGLLDMPSIDAFDGRGLFEEPNQKIEALLRDVAHIHDM